jgi:dTDP-4-amino-4,6-dideoxy-D-galactose acyltransferase
MIQKLDWDTNFFGYNVGVFKHKRNDVFDFELFKKEAAQFTLTYLFSENEIVITGLKLVEIKLEFQKTIIPSEISLPTNIKFYDNSKNDIHALKKLVLLSGHYSRFKLDANFEYNEFERMYSTWITKSTGNILVKTYNDELVGFVLYTLDNESARIDLISVFERYQGKGFASELIHQVEYLASQRGIERLHVATQEVNKNASNLYIKNKFKLFSKTYIYHNWEK